MRRRTLGIGLIGIGGAVALLAVLGLLTRPSNDEPIVATPTSTAAPMTQPPSQPPPETVTPTAVTPPPTTGRPPSTSGPPPSTTDPPAPTTTVPAGIGLVEPFILAFTEAVRSGDADYLLSRLHPVVEELYGAAACAAYVPGVIDTDLELVVREVAGPDTWDWTIDGVTTAIPDTYAVEVSRLEGGQTIIQELHVSLFDGEIRWFTDCGEPL